MHFTKSKVFKKINTVRYIVDPCLEIMHAKCQADISIFGKHIAQKPYPLMTSFSQTTILSISRYRTEIQMTFLESWDQSGSEAHIWYLKNQKIDHMWHGVDRPFPVIDFQGVT